MDSPLRIKNQVCPPAPKKKHYSRNLTDEELRPVKRILFPNDENDRSSPQSTNHGVQLASNI